jgi:Ca2+-dependent lipid-binding protein
MDPFVVIEYNGVRERTKTA